MEYKIGTEEVISLDYYFRVLGVDIGVNDGILLKYGTYYRLGIIDGITHK